MAFCNPADDNQFYSQQRMKNDRLRNFGTQNGSHRTMQARDAARRTDYEALIAHMLAAADGDDAMATIGDAAVADGR